ncbi:flagellar hook assembly protein FlgD [Spirochaetia bacterium 38H-sp]|uniref:Basal-body rod modification protein FlgD n=1 Tax=Rarispira pelagica TaxID=3141764 RepID=A0ABU9UDA9_9SPIR
MELSTIMTGADRAKVEAQVDAINKSLQDGRKIKQNLDKDDFLKLLITQLTHQDPTQPLEDKEFIAQMAQFSSLEQITNMNTELAKMSGRLMSSQAVSLLGRTVSVKDGDNIISGVVDEIRGNDFPQLRINNRFYDISAVESILSNAQGGEL